VAFGFVDPRLRGDDGERKKGGMTGKEGRGWRDKELRDDGKRRAGMTGKEGRE